MGALLSWSWPSMGAADTDLAGPCRARLPATCLASAMLLPALCQAVSDSSSQRRALRLPAPCCCLHCAMPSVTRQASAAPCTRQRHALSRSAPGPRPDRAAHRLAQSARPYLLHRARSPPARVLPPSASDVIGLCCARSPPALSQAPACLGRSDRIPLP